MLFVKKYRWLGKPLSLSMAVALLIGCSDVTFDWTEEGRQEWEASRPRIVINNGAQFTNSLQVELTITGENIEKMYLTNDPKCEGAGHWEIFQSAKGWNLDRQQSNTTATVYARFQEKNGKLTDCTQDAIIHDDVPPEVAIEKAPDILTNQTASQFTFQASDEGSGIDGFECSDDQNLTFQRCLPQFQKHFGEGPHSFFVKARDLAGNVSTPKSYEWTIDVTPPEIKLLKAPARWIKENNSPFEFVAFDLHGIDSYECSIDQVANYQKCQSPFAPIVTVNQIHRIYIRALDRLGNQSNSIIHEWGVDQQGPEIIYTKIPIGMKTHSQNSVAFSVRDNMAGNSLIRCAFNQKEVPCNFEDSVIVNNLFAGAQTFSILAIDLLGNQSQLNGSWNVLPGYDSKNQPVPIAGPPPVDILFITDNSQSMRDEQKEMGNRFPDFLKSLDGLNWQIGITTTDLSREDGRLLPFKGATNLFVLDWLMLPSLSDSLFKATIQRTESGSSSEQGIGAAMRAIERIDTDGAQRNAKLFRATAYLAMIVLTDEDEWDDYYQKRPQLLVNMVNQRWGANKRFEFHSIIARPEDKACTCDLNYVNPDECTGDSEHKEGHSYALLTRLTHGILGNVCAPNYSAQLKSIGDSIQNKVNQVELDCTPIDMNYDGKIDLEIILNPAHHEPLKYALKGKTLLFEKPLPEGDHIFKYFCFP